jgi:hypothetical protein
VSVVLPHKQSLKIHSTKNLFFQQGDDFDIMFWVPLLDVMMQATVGMF